MYTRWIVQISRRLTPDSGSSLPTFPFFMVDPTVGRIRALQGFVVD